jgi:hypothetical protein
VDVLNLQGAVDQLHDQQARRLRSRGRAQLTASVLQALHRPPPGEVHALGWNDSSVWIAPRERFQVLVCTNRDGSFEATIEAAGGLWITE